MSGIKKSKFIQEMRQKELLNSDTESDEELEKPKKTALPKNPMKKKKDVYVSDSEEGEIEIEDKPKKKAYVLTEGRKQAFEKARMKRAENVEFRKQQKEKEDTAYNAFLDKKKLKKQKSVDKKKALEIKKLDVESSSEDETTDEKPVKAPPKKKVSEKKKKVVYSDSDSDSEIETKKGRNKIVIINKLDKGNSQQPQPQLKRNLFC
jgi:hypothetical protein